MLRKFLYIFILTLFLPCVGFAKSSIVTDFKPACDSISVLLQERTGVKWRLKLQQVTKRGNSLDFYFDTSLSDYPLRAEDDAWLRSMLQKLRPKEYSQWQIGEIYCKGYGLSEKLSELSVSPINSNGTPMATKYHRNAPDDGVIVREDGAPTFSRGMSGRHIALWPSHGLYYDNDKAKWQWQRPLLFQTVEDLFSTSFVLPYLVPMLENAGAYVMLPRERDTGTVELIVDNDPGESSRLSGTYREKGSWTSAGTGFADDKEEYTGEDNPFKLGTARQAACTSNSGSNYASASWTPDIPRRNSYAVYVSYKTLDNSTTAAHYTVHHLGGTSSFTVNQRMGGGTWIYLGTFEFAEGTGGSIELDNVSSAGGIVSADAVKIGGGMGNIARSVKNDPLSEEETSGMPRYTEAARYWLQWAGIDPKVYSQHELKNDYRDDLFSRGDWVDYLSGGSSVNPKKAGKNIPFDLTLAFHTDAGVTQTDSIIGSLVIYSRVNELKRDLPDGSDRRTIREFADIVQSQIVGDLQGSMYDAWQRRQIWNRGYRESRTPPTPTILTESLSHQNFADMRYGQDPEFKFTLSRAIYKGMLKYLSSRYGCPYVVQPLPVQSFAAEVQDSRTIRLSWLPRKDSLEPTAVAKEYMLYTRKGDGAFDSGRIVRHSTGADGRLYVDVTVNPGEIYSYKITALNDGGESFPSEVLAAGIPEGRADGFGGKYVMVVNNFTRVSAPAWYDSAEYAGFNNGLDSGVPYVKEIAFTGEMYYNHRKLEWESDENPDFGASYNDHSGYPVAGNTFDFVYRHGKSIMAAGVPFCSMSADAFASAGGKVGAAAIDIICGKQVTTLQGGKGGRTKYTVFPTAFQTALKTYTSGGGNVLISGAHIGSDISDAIYPIQPDKNVKSSTSKFVQNVFGWRPGGGNASRSGSINIVRKAENAKAAKAGNDSSTPRLGNSPQQTKPGRFYCTVRSSRFNTEFSESVYRVEAPDALSPSGKNSAAIFRYSDSNNTAGISFIASDGHRAVSFGFPLETLLEDNDLNEIIFSSLEFFGL